MTENPYHAPQSMPIAVGVLSGTRDDLRSVAKCQKGILVCILIDLVAIFGRFALPPEAQPLVVFGVPIVVLVGAVFVFMLAIKVEFPTERGRSCSVLYCTQGVFRMSKKSNQSERRVGVGPDLYFHEIRLAVSGGDH